MLLIPAAAMPHKWFTKAEILPSSTFIQKRPGKGRVSPCRSAGQAINHLKAYKNILTERSGPVFCLNERRGGKCLSQSINITGLTNISGFFGGNGKSST